MLNEKFMPINKKSMVLHDSMAKLSLICEREK